MPIDQFFRPTDVESSHPFLRLVSSRKQQGDEPVFELYRPREALGFRKARIVVHFGRNGHEEDHRSEDWDDDVNAGLVSLGVKARSLDEEKDRFALGLRAALKKPEKRYGDGYFNAVLVQYIRQTDFNSHPEAAVAMEHISSPRPHEGQALTDCIEMIDAAVRGRAEELTSRLGYSKPEAWDILAAAMARYLDERFSVTNRRLLGLL